MVPNEVIQAAEAWTSPHVARWSANLHRSLGEWLKPNVALVGDADWGARIRDLVKLPIEDPLEWANRRIALPDDQWAITGIRFRDRDTSKPFVDIIATSLAPDASRLDKLTDILPHYASFSPLCLRAGFPDPYQTLADVAQPDAYVGSAVPDLLVVAGALEELLQHPLQETFSSVEIQRCEPRFAAERVAEIYAELAVTRPDITAWAPPADLDTLSSAEEEGFLFDVRVGSASIGVIAAIREDAYGMSGYCVQELCLDAEHRGKRLGPAVLQRLCRELPIKNPGDVLWGHIHSQNIPSLRNATAIGRRVVGGHLWLTPDGYKGMPS